MFDFLKRIVDKHDDHLSVIFEYTVKKENISSTVEVFHGFAELLAKEATRFIESSKTQLPAMELRFTNKFRPVSVFVVLDEFGSPLEKVKELYQKNIFKDEKIKQLEVELEAAQKTIEQKTKIIGDLVSATVIEVRNSNAGMVQSVAEKSVGSSVGKVQQNGTKPVTQGGGSVR